MAVELRCPSCTVVLARVPRSRATVGRPFEECAKCRTFVVRPATNEWDLMGTGRKFLWLVDRLAPFLVLGLVPAFGYWALVVRKGGGDARLLQGLLAGGPVLLALLPIAAARHAIRRSRSRMADPMYRARMIEFRRREVSVGRS